MDNGKPLIELKDVAKAYGDNVVLKKINLQIGDGEFLVLVGPSGCGKSTLLRCIAGLEEITRGELRIDGKMANHLHPKDRDLAMVFQSYALYPHLTVYDNVAFSLTVRKMDKAEIDKRVMLAAKRLGIEKLLDRLPKQLSGGQRQRVAVGRAIVREPVAFLFDEPLSNLDAELRGQMRVELKALHRDLGATMIYVTHDQIEAMTLADRIVVLEGGDIQQVGTPDELYRKPDNRFVARFIGSPPMNFFRATVDRNSAKVTGEGFSLPLPDTAPSPGDLPDEVIAGVRPVDLLPTKNDDAQCMATVDVVEPVGWDAFLHVTIGANKAVAQVQAKEVRRLQAGDKISFAVKSENVHLFDANKEYALRVKGEK